MSKFQWTARVGGIALAAAGVFLALCLLTYSPRDVALLTYPPKTPITNLCGTVGVWFLKFECFWLLALCW